MILNSILFKFIEFLNIFLKSIRIVTKIVEKIVFKEFQEMRKTDGLNDKCLSLCPIDCLTVDYFYDILETDSFVRNDYWFELNSSQRYSKTTLIWDSTQPMYAYNEESVMSFTDYLSSFGGLFGFWLGFSAKDITDWFIQSNLWTLFNNTINRLSIRTSRVIPFSQ